MKQLAIHVPLLSAIRKLLTLHLRLLPNWSRCSLEFLVILPTRCHQFKVIWTGMESFGPTSLTFFFNVTQVLKKEKVDYIVAPYEADAQMTFLSVNKIVDAVITEDSDLIPFGCSRVSTLLQPSLLWSKSSKPSHHLSRFPLVACCVPSKLCASYSNVQIIFKMDKFGQGVEFHITRLERNRELDFNGFTRQMLLEMCILSGCDYLPSLPGMGVKRAHALIQKLKCHEKVNHVFCVAFARATFKLSYKLTTGEVNLVACIIAGNQAPEVRCCFCSTSVWREFQKGNLGI